MSLDIRINGEDRTIDEVSSLAGLLERLGIDSEGIAVAHNGAVVPRDRLAETPVEDGDVLEVIRAVAGG
jgi:thiamine biosynthesis protein ThiS